MTVRDYIIKNFEMLGINDVPYEIISVELEKTGLSDSDELTPNTNLDLFYYNIIPNLLLMPKSVSEGGFSVSYDGQALKDFYHMVAGRLGKPNQLATNKITDITAVW